MDAFCKIQRSIHVFNITNKSMCPDFWVHITQRDFKRNFYKIIIKVPATIPTSPIADFIESFSWKTM